jgi:hypothetical protein
VTVGSEAGSPRTESTILWTAWRETHPEAARSYDALKANRDLSPNPARFRDWQETFPVACRDWAGIVVFGSRRADPWSGEVRARQLDRVCREHGLHRLIGAAAIGGEVRCALGVADAAGYALVLRDGLGPTELQHAEEEVLLEILRSHPLGDRVAAYVPDPRRSPRLDGWARLSHAGRRHVHSAVDMCRSALHEPPPRGVPRNIEAAALDRAAEALPTRWGELDDDQHLHLMWAAEVGLAWFRDPAAPELPGHGRHRVPSNLHERDLRVAIDGLWPLPSTTARR